MNAETEIVPTDIRGRVRVSRERRAALLEEFDRSGMSAARFAAYVGVKYPTFASWIQSRKRSATRSATAELEVDATATNAKWVEAVVENNSPTPGPGLTIYFPGQVRVEIPDAKSVRLAAELLREWSKQPATSLQACSVLPVR